MMTAEKVTKADGLLPPKERAQHDGVRVERRSVTRDQDGSVTGTTYGAKVMSVSPVQRLWRQDRITDQQFFAAKRLYGSFYRGGLSRTVTLSLTRVHARSNPNAGLSENQLEAREEFNAAMKSVSAELTDLLWDVVCAELTLEKVEFSRQWRHGKAILFLREALDELSRYYGAQKSI